MKKLLWTGFYLAPLLAYAANFNEPRAPRVSPRTALHRDTPSSPEQLTPVKMIVYKSEPGAQTSLSGDSSLWTKLHEERASVQQVKSYVSNRAKDYGVNPFLALWIVKHESSFNPRAKGDGEESRGLWQISRIYHPEVSDDVAFGVESSTDWSLARIRDGKVNEWSAYRNCRTLYADCPF